MEQDYILRSGTVNPTVPENYIQKKWEDLILKLNSSGNGACLSVEDWKKVCNNFVAMRYVYAKYSSQFMSNKMEMTNTCHRTYKINAFKCRMINKN